MQGHTTQIHPAVPGQNPGFILPTGTKDGYPSYSRHPNLGLAGTQLTLGILSIIFNIAGIIFWSSLSIIGIGIWGGIMIVIAGAFGIAASHYRTKCTVITTLVMSIMSALMGLGIAINSSVGIIFDDMYGYGRHYLCSSLNGCLIVFGVLEMIIAIIQAAFCCKHMGSSNNPNYQVVTLDSLSMPNASASANPNLLLNIKGQLVPMGSVQTGSPLVVMVDGSYMSAAAPNQILPPAYSANNTTQASEEKEDYTKE